MTTPDNEKQPAYEPHTFTEGGGGLCGKCGHAIYNRLHEVVRRKGTTPLRGRPLDDNGGIEFEQPAASGLTKEREQEIRRRVTQDAPHAEHYSMLDVTDLLSELDRLRTTPQPAEQALQDEIDARDSAVAEIQKLLPSDFLVNAGPYEWFVEAAKAQQAHIRSLEQQLAAERTQRHAGQD